MLVTIICRKGCGKIFRTFKGRQWHEDNRCKGNILTADEILLPDLVPVPITPEQPVPEPANPELTQLVSYYESHMGVASPSIYAKLKQMLADNGLDNSCKAIDAGARMVRNRKRRQL